MSGFPVGSRAWPIPPARGDEESRDRVGRQQCSAGDRSWAPSLTGTATPAIGDNATEVPEAGLAAVTLEAPHARAAGALACGRFTGATVGTVGVALARACKARARQGHRSCVALPGCGSGPGSGTH